MSYAALEQKLRRIPARELETVSRFLDSVLTVSEAHELPAARQLGRWNGRIWMADDFDDTPDCFKDYL